MIREQHAIRYRASLREPRYVIHCLTRTCHYAWTRHPVTYAQALRFLERAAGKANRCHWFEPV